jgi:hypothetical protein
MCYRSKYNWGTHLWNYIHTITIIDFVSEQDNLYHSTIAYNVLKNLQFTCKKCQKEYEEELKNIDINLLSKSMYLFEWSWNLHNKINNKLNKNIITYEEALELHSIKI